MSREGRRGRPGEIIPGPVPVPTARPGRHRTVLVTNRGRVDAYLTSHFAVREASEALGFDRDGLGWTRPRLPAGASVSIPAGETVAVELTWT